MTAAILLAATLSGIIFLGYTFARVSVAYLERDGNFETFI